MVRKTAVSRWQLANSKKIKKKKIFGQRQGVRGNGKNEFIEFVEFIELRVGRKEDGE